MGSKKRPIAMQSHAHSGLWLSSLGCLAYSDLALSGSSDGWLKLWKCGGSGGKSQGPYLQCMSSIAITGHLNGISVARSGAWAVVAVGQEHRLGRWTRIGAARNGVHLVRFNQNLMPNTESVNETQVFYIII